MNPIYASPKDNLPAISETELSDSEVLIEIAELKKQFQGQVLVLGHHYQQDDVIAFADVTGDSLALAQIAAKNQDVPYIIFCGVHFMAETADILTRNTQQVLLPDLNAGCSMADMAQLQEVEKAWEYIQSSLPKSSVPQKVIPITYINCAANLKAFVGRHEGSICTSSNAEKIIKWAFNKGDKLLFFPDQHLGRNTCFKLGIPLQDMVVYNPLQQHGGLTPQQIAQAKVILWYGYCSVHQGFNVQQVRTIKQQSPNTQVIVHPECSFDVVQEAHDAGSTSYIIDKIAQAPAGSHFAVGTEINLVNRLAQKFPDKHISSLSPYQCLCTTMYRVRPRWLLESFRSIKRGNPINIIQVPEEIRQPALLALQRMLEISK